MTAEPAFLVTYPIPEPGLGALRAAGRVYIPDTPPTADELRDACGSGDFDVVEWSHSCPTGSTPTCSRRRS